MKNLPPEKIIKSTLGEYGVVLIRTDFSSVFEFSNFYTEYLGKDFQYNCGNTPRSEVLDSVYTATDFRSDKVITLHSEMSYCEQWPKYLSFFCLNNTAIGGEVLIADNRKIFDDIANSRHSDLLSKEIEYRRYFGGAFTRSIEQAFSGIPMSTILENNNIRMCNNTIQISHKSSQYIDGGYWFNQISTFHDSNFDDVTRCYYKDNPEQFPGTISFSCGNEIPDKYVEFIKKVEKTHTVTYYYRPGDILLMDNTSMSHGRNPYSGTREVYVRLFS